MLDLNKLEKKLDLALANETEESLRNWLTQKRSNDFIESLGEGRLESGIKIISKDTDMSERNTSMESEFQEILTSTEYLLAA